MEELNSNLNRIKQIETTTLTSVSLRGSYKMVSHDDFRFLIDQAKNANKEDMDMEVISINAVDYEMLRFYKSQIEELNKLADQLENGDIDNLEFSYAVLNVL